MKLSKKQVAFCSNVGVSLAMTVVMTGGMLWIHAGWSADFFTLWLQDFGVGSCIAVPTGLVVVPLISNGLERFSE